MAYMRYGCCDLYGESAQITRFLTLVDPLVWDRAQTGITEESSIRLELQSELDRVGLKVQLVYKGNSVFPFKRLTQQFARLMKNYRYSLFTDELYKFLSLCCGSAAHSNKLGWFELYDTPERMRVFLDLNEFGQDVVAYQPQWAGDSRKIAEQFMVIAGVRPAHPVL